MEAPWGYDVSVHIFLELSTHRRMMWSLSNLATILSPSPEEAGYSVLQTENRDAFGGIRTTDLRHERIVH